MKRECVKKLIGWIEDRRWLDLLVGFNKQRKENLMAEGKPNETLIAFESGHYKKVKGEWKGDSVWCHFKKANGGMVHINKEKVEYMESFGPGDSPNKPDKHDG